ncbi:MAG: S8 family serine peptidase [Deltaproteobacteria bacterium]|jgi:hypothetical protein
MKRLNNALWIAPLLVAACGAPEEPVETAEAGITPAQQSHCDALRAAGATSLPWYCGGLQSTLPPELDRACPDNQWVGYRLTSAPCPVVTAPPALGTWNKTEPFTGSIPGLERWCVYRWEPAVVGTPPDTSVLPDTPDLRLERDCEVVSAHARLPNGAWQPLSTAYLEQIDVPEIAGLPFQQTTRVAIVDSSLERVGAVSEGLSRHGEAMGSVVHNLTCLGPNGAPCGAELSNHLALPRIDTETYGERGGHYGTQSELGVAMFQAIFSWRFGPTWTPGSRFIMNLSVGWNEAYGGAPSNPSLPAKLVYQVAQYASCNGALMIAASGNRSTDLTPGPIFPAGWERATPFCSDAPPNAYDPLVHAVGGVDGRDSTLALSRIASQPRLVAPAAQVNVEQPVLNNVPTVIASGTSFAAAGVSATAALVWSLRPNLQPYQVMQVVYQSAIPVGGASDFGLNNQAFARRRVSVCRAVTLACLGLACPPLPACENRAAGVDATADFATAISITYPGLMGPQNAVPGPSATNPSDLDPFKEPWVVPQPDEEPCPLCGITAATFEGQIDQDIAQSGATITNSTVIVTTFQGDEFVIAVDIPDPTQPFEIELAQLQDQDLKTGKFELTTDEKGEETVRVSELFIKP